MGIEDIPPGENFSRARVIHHDLCKGTERFLDYAWHPDFVRIVNEDFEILVTFTTHQASRLAAEILEDSPPWR